MGGLPVFAGTRVPVETIAACKAAGIPDARLIASYPFLTPSLIEAAVRYQQTQPRARLCSLGELNPDWVIVESRVVR